MSQTGYIIDKAVKPHRLVLMLAYGYGLRLEEVRTIRSSYFGFEKRLLRFCQSKGQKDRIVMLDPVIAEAVHVFLKNRPEGYL
jgi:integrase